MECYDLLIIGAGPSGINVAIEAQKRGRSFVLLDKGTLVNSIYHFPTNMTFFSTSRKLEIGGVPFISHGDKPTRREALEYYRRVVEHWNIQARLYEPVQAVEPDENHRIYTVKTTKNRYETRNIVVATGFYGKPNLLNVPGEDLPKVKHYYDDPHPYSGQRVLVVGAANSAVDVALETWRAGAEVTMVIREEEISSRVKYWVRPDIENRIREGSIRAFFESHVTAIRPQEVDIRTPEGARTIGNDFVMAMTGYRPDFAWLKGIGLPLSKDEDQAPLHHPETLETPMPGVFVTGVVAAGKNTATLYIENTRDHAARILDYLERQQYNTTKKMAVSQS